MRVCALMVFLGSLLTVACGESGRYRRHHEVVTPVLEAPGATAMPRMQLTLPTTVGGETHAATQLIPWTIRTVTGTRVAAPEGAAALDVPLAEDLRGTRWLAVAIERTPGTPPLPAADAAPLELIQIVAVPPGANSVRLPYSWHDLDAPKVLLHPMPDLTELDVTSGAIAVPAGAELVFYEAINGLVGSRPAPLAFTVTALEGGRETQLHQAVLDPSRRSEDRKWVPQRADLSALAGHTIQFRFAARLADGSAGASLPMWGDPALHVRKPLANVFRVGMRDLLTRGACLAPVARLNPPDLTNSNVVVIGIDTLRADHLGSYGYRRPTSPHIDALAAGAVVFANAISQSPWTLPSFASIFTGLLPSVHRAGEGERWTRSPLDARVRTLATELHRAGWRTGSFVSNSFAGRSVGLAEGYDTARESLWLNSEGVIPEARAFLRTNGHERFFAFVHLIDPHYPYTPPAEDAAPFLDPTYRGQVGTAFDTFPVPADFTAADRQRVIDLYDGEVHVSDRHVGEIVDLLGELDVLERTIVVIVSDHGEELFDHGTNGHGHTLYDELLHVPLIIRFPGGCWAQRVDQQVRTMDLFPTILGALRLPAPPNLQGQNLMPLIQDGVRTPGGDLAISEFLFVPREQKSVRRDGFKLVYTPVTNGTKAFDLVTDPRELVDVAQRRTGDVGTLRAVLEREVLRRAEGFEIVARSGREAHQLRIRLESPGGFGGVSLVGAEDGQPVAVSNEGRTIEATFRLPPATKASEAGDSHVLRFQVEGDQQFGVEAEVDGLALDPTDFFLGPLTTRAEVAPPWRFGADDDRLAVPFPPELSPSPAGSVRIALYRVRRPPPPPATLDDKTRENLRQLGYMQ